ncbi:MAG: serine/threonine-protein phosphatase [Deltaproteobacteria bacterium]|nr:serine/threonine-protein phosphatase [Deltaproteobacteria bacterium]MBW1736522.1 serine/threonine-protein phosphatase [Deltaproteobacteria bacterium]MBW1908656.1 serine/threonine-protein phosphatase [Deltaproteobacteria bacterium]MBW2033399.1 serine/threonine-protein phosphatase [Deltaproteobacteria bacterium]MBW2113945.1 serine/threonine-protein phosphatase [Deltaproteobacteria bacterium]
MGTALTRSAGLTDVGLKREGNEDSLSVDESLNLYIVADGMGGHLAGEVASRTAVDLINKSYRKWKGSETPEEEIFGCPDTSLSRSGNYILSSILLANKVIYEMATEHKKYKGMGTTVAVLAVMPGLIISANAGDSPIYMIRNGRIEKISKDHNFVAEQVEMGLMTEEEAAESPMKHVLTKNLGSYEELNPDIFEIVPAKNDRFVLCSDGLTDLVTDDEILQMVEEVQDPEVLCRNFIDMALKRGGHDNTTVVTVSLSDTGKPKTGPMKKMGALLTDISTVMQKRSKKNRR